MRGYRVLEAAVPVQDALGPAGGAGGVVQDRGSVGRGGLHDVRRGRLGHHASIADDPVRRIVLSVHQHDVLELREPSPDARHLLVEAPPRDEADGARVAQPVEQGVLAEAGEQRPADRPRLQGPEEREELLRHPGEEREEDVSLADAASGEGGGEAVALEL
jgi:hypothetical protein